MNYTKGTCGTCGNWRPGKESKNYFAPHGTCHVLPPVLNTMWPSVPHDESCAYQCADEEHLYSDELIISIVQEGLDSGTLKILSRAPTLVLSAELSKKLLLPADIERDDKFRDRYTEGGDGEPHSTGGD